MTEKKVAKKGVSSANIASPASASQEAKQSAMHRDGFFTSDLSVDEFLLLDESGFEPLRLVIGSSIYHIGYQPKNWLQNQEMDVLSQAMYDARGWAMKRMIKEANALKADGIVGVHIEVTPHEGKEALAEFVAIGTAVRACNPDTFRSAGGKFFASDLSVQDFWTLRRAGYWPRGVVMGNCVYHIAPQSPGSWIGRNAEMTNYTTALYDARELAMKRMQDEALKLKAEGVVGMHILTHNHGWGSRVIEFFAIGTAIVSVAANHQIQTPSLSLLLNN